MNKETEKLMLESLRWLINNTKLREDTKLSECDKCGELLCNLDMATSPIKQEIPYEKSLA